MALTFVRANSDRLKGNATLAHGIGTGDCTMMGWARLTVEPDYGVICCTDSGSSFDAASLAISAKSATGGPGWGAIIDGVTFVTFGTDLALNTTYHLAIVRSGSTITGYVNGVSDGTMSSAASVANDVPIFAGEEGGSSYADCILQDWSICAAAIPVAAILNIVNGRLRAVAEILPYSPRGYWPMDVPGDATYDAFTNGDFGGRELVAGCHLIIGAAADWSEDFVALHWPTGRKAQAAALPDVIPTGGLVIGSAISFVGEGQIGAIDEVAGAGETAAPGAVASEERHGADNAQVAAAPAAVPVADGGAGAGTAQAQVGTAFDESRIGTAEVSMVVVALGGVAPQEIGSAIASVSLEQGFVASEERIGASIAFVSVTVELGSIASSEQQGASQVGGIMVAQGAAQDASQVGTSTVSLAAVLGYVPSSENVPSSALDTAAVPGFVTSSENAGAPFALAEGSPGYVSSEERVGASAASAAVFVSPGSVPSSENVFGAEASVATAPSYAASSENVASASVSVASVLGYVASEERIGASSADTAVFASPGSVPSSENVVGASASLDVVSGYVASEERSGASLADVSLFADPGSIPSSENVVGPAVSIVFTSGFVPSEERQGSSVVGQGQDVIPGAVLSGEVIGGFTIAMPLSPGSVASAERMGASAVAAVAFAHIKVRERFLDEYDYRADLTKHEDLL